MQTAADLPVACTLGSAALDRRLAWIRRVTEHSLLSHRLDAKVLRLTYRGDALPDIEQIVAQERECCAFMRYSLESSPGEVRLTIEAPDVVGPDAKWLFDQFLPQVQSNPVRNACGCGPGACS